MQNNRFGDVLEGPDEPSPRIEETFREAIAIDMQKIVGAIFIDKWKIFGGDG